MEYTEKQKAAFRARFAQKRQYQVALIVPVGGAVLLLFLVEPFAADLALQTRVLGTAALFLGAAAFSWLNWRCPACKKYLGNVLNPSQCPKCGLALRSR